MKPYNRRYGLKLICDNVTYTERWSIVDHRNSNIIFNFAEMRNVFKDTPTEIFIEREIRKHDVINVTAFQVLENICNYLNREVDDRQLYLSHIKEYINQ